jgi:hypothetical protein
MLNKMTSLGGDKKSKNFFETTDEVEGQANQDKIWF